VSAAQGGRENASKKILSDVTIRYEKEKKEMLDTILNHIKTSADTLKLIEENMGNL